MWILRRLLCNALLVYVLRGLLFTSPADHRLSERLFILYICNKWNILWAALADKRSKSHIRDQDYEWETTDGKD